MVDFGLTDEQKMIQETVHDFAKKEIRPVAPEYDAKSETPWPVMKKAAELELSKFELAAIMEDPITSLLVAEELNWGCAGIATAIGGSGLAAAGLQFSGTDAQIESFMPKLTSTAQEIKLGAMGLTEPEAGSDVANLSTTAVKDGDEYILNGTKCFITNGGIADLHVIFATADKSLGWMGIGCYAIEKGTEGLSMGSKYDKLGVRASHTAEVIMEDCRVPAGNRLGGDPDSDDYDPMKGALGALKMLDISRISVGMSALGIARASSEYALDYAKTRIQFGKPIAMQQSIAFMLAEMFTEVDAGRLLCWRASWMASQGMEFARGESSMAKYYGGDTAMRCSTDAVQILGGYGYMKEYPVEKWMRDAKIFQIWEGTAQIQRLVISRQIIGRLEKQK